MIFVDTGAWFAATVPDDADHQAANDFLKANNEPLVTTDYVIDEVLTLLKARGEFQRALVFGTELLEEDGCQLEWVGRDDVSEAWVTFQQFKDKDWSFTDCVSRAVMSRLGIDKAFAFDEHFRQFGTVTVLP
jgi:predicted nucleic acid-binding protein